MRSYCVLPASKNDIQLLLINMTYEFISSDVMQMI